MASAVANLAIKIVGDSKQARGAIKSLDKSISGFASNAVSLLGAASIGAWVVDCVKAAGVAEVSTARLSQSVANSGKAWAKYRDRVNAAVESTHKLAAVDDEELQDALARVVTKTGDLDTALAQLPLLADISAAGFGDLSSAADIVSKVMNGQYGQLKRMGIIIPKTASKTEALALMQEKFGGQAKKAGDTSEGAALRAAQAYEDLQEAIGSRLAPRMEDLANKTADLLDSFDKLPTKAQDATIEVAGFGAAAYGVGAVLGALGGLAMGAAGVIAGIAGAAGYAAGSLFNMLPGVGKAQAKLGKFLDLLLNDTPRAQRMAGRAFEIVGGEASELADLLSRVGRRAIDSVTGLDTLGTRTHMLGRRFDRLTDAINRAFDTLARRTRAAASSIAHVSTPEVEPIRRARGGIVSGAQFSIVGEDGPEAIVPLSSRYRNDALSILPTVLAAVGAQGGAGNTYINITGDRADANAIATQVRAVLAQSISPVPAMG